MNINRFDHRDAAYYTVAREAVLAGAVESRLEVGARGVWMACRRVLGALIEIATGERTVLVEDRAIDPALLGLASTMILATWTSVKVRIFVDADSAGKLAWWWVKFLALVEVSAIWRTGPSGLADTLVVDTSGTFVAFCVTTYSWGITSQIADNGVVVTKVMPLGTTEHKSDRMGEYESESRSELHGSNVSCV